MTPKSERKEARGVIPVERVDGATEAEKVGERDQTGVLTDETGGEMTEETHPMVKVKVGKVGRAGKESPSLRVQGQKSVNFT